jgi:hypothetical protein
MDFDTLLSTFKVQSDLERNIWADNDKLHPKIRTALLTIAKNFYDGLELTNKPPIKDIIFTGSLANYNWSKYSDIDVHLLFDFSEYGEYKEIFEHMFLLAKSRWNDKHSVKVKGYDVEIYAEDMNNPHHSTGVYSIQDDAWVKKPEQATPIVDAEDIKSKVQYFINMYKLLIQSAPTTAPKELLKVTERLRDKIAKFRQAGLESTGEYSVENISFKVLRRIGLLDKLAEFRDKLVDVQLSVETKR